MYMKSIITLLFCLVQLSAEPTVFRYLLEGTMDKQEMKLFIYEYKKTDRTFLSKDSFECTFESLSKNEGDLMKSGKAYYKSSSGKRHAIVKILKDNYNRLLEAEGNYSYFITPDKDILVDATKIDKTFSIEIRTDETMPVPDFVK